MEEKRIKIIRHALNLAKDTGSERLFVFMNTLKEIEWLFRSETLRNESIVPVVPETLDISKTGIKNYKQKFVRIWTGNQTRFSRIKYALLQGVLKGVISEHSRVVCVLGPSGKSSIDTITIHDLSHPWSEGFPFTIHSFVKNKAF